MWEEKREIQRRALGSRIRNCKEATADVSTAVLRSTKRPSPKMTLLFGSAEDGRGKEVRELSELVERVE
jgi:hypothetical protein